MVRLSSSLTYGMLASVREPEFSLRGIYLVAFEALLATKHMLRFNCL